MSEKLTPRLLPRRPYRCYFSDSKAWDEFEPRPGDIIISTPSKAGTTWTQRIVSVLVFQQPRLPKSLWEISPWPDCTFVPREAMFKVLQDQQHRRFMKTHLPLEAMPFYEEVSYVVVGRDLRDLAVSNHNQAVGLNDTPVEYPAPQGEEVYTPEKPVVTEDVRQYWRDFFTRSPFPWESNGWPYNSPTHHLASWWEVRDAPNVIFLHYQDMLDDLDKEMRRLSAFLDIPVDESIWPQLVSTCTFDDMKSRANEVIPGQMLEGMKYQFFHKGRSGQWRDVIGDDDMALYEAALEGLPDDLRSWLVRTV